MRPLLLLLLALGGCANVATLTQALNDRGVQSCVFYTGSSGPFLGVHGITATGGATLEQCQPLR